jgi:hypothetical protein
VSPLLDCVALPVGHHELYITWLDPATHAVVEVLVMNFASRTVCNCVPGSAAPESAGAITVVDRGAEPLP